MSAWIVQASLDTRSEKKEKAKILALGAASVLGQQVNKVGAIVHKGVHKRNAKEEWLILWENSLWW